jgi:hypothetical protein
MSLERFLDDDEDPHYNEKVDTETRNRIRLCVAAYAYEFMDVSIMSDGDFDALAKKIDVTVDTRRPDLDKWFRENFAAHTGQWIHNHPEKPKLRSIAFKLLKNV